MGMDPRSMSGPELHMAMNQVRTSIDAPDYFHHPGRTPYPRYDEGMAASTPYSGDFEAGRSMAPYDLEIESSKLNHRYGIFYVHYHKSKLTHDLVPVSMRPILRHSLPIVRSLTPPSTANYTVKWSQPSSGLAADDDTAHIGDDGRYPADFNIPKTVETIRLLEGRSIPCCVMPYLVTNRRGYFPRVSYRSVG